VVQITITEPRQTIHELLREKRSITTSLYGFNRSLRQPEAEVLYTGEGYGVESRIAAALLRLADRMGHVKAGRILIQSIRAHRSAAGAGNDPSDLKFGGGSVPKNP
jgi:hypothetical protein